MDACVDFVRRMVPAESASLPLVSPPDSTPELLLHMDGVDTSTVFIDSMARHAVTAEGLAQVDTAQFVFGNASALFTAEGDDLVVSGNLGDFIFPRDFTIDCLVQCSAFNAGSSFVVHSDESSSLTGRFFLFIDNLGNVSWRISGVSVIAAPAPINLSQWYHMAVVRFNGITTLYFDGVPQGAPYAGTETLVTNQLTGLGIGARTNSTGSLLGWIDEFRVIQGYAAWRGPFVPPSYVYTP